MWLSTTFSVLLLLVDIVMQQFHDQVHMGEDHAATAVPLAAQLIKGIPGMSNKRLTVRMII